MKPIKWHRSPTGRLISESSRFLIDNPLPIKAKCLVVDHERRHAVPETRVRMVDRVGGGKGEKGESVGRVYLCLDIIHAQALAADILAGRGCLAPF